MHCLLPPLICTIARCVEVDEVMGVLNVYDLLVLIHLVAQLLQIGRIFRVLRQVLACVDEHGCCAGCDPRVRGIDVANERW